MIESTKLPSRHKPPLSKLKKRAENSMAGLDLSLEKTGHVFEP